MDRPRVLIIDDSGAFRALLRARLERMGFEIAAEAESGHEGLEQFRALRPDLITLDLVMPDPHAFDTRALFRTFRAEAPATPIVVISSASRRANADGFLTEGAFAYLEKSFANYDELATRLRKKFPSLPPAPAS